MELGVLIVYSKEEFDNIKAWADRDEQHSEISYWLEQYVSMVNIGTLPVRLCFPKSLIVQMNELIADWQEVLSAQKESTTFRTRTLKPGETLPV
jgi:hypothetical protein